MSGAVRGYQIGDKVRYSCVLRRYKLKTEAGWECHDEEGEGVVVGHRVVKEGKMRPMSDWDEYSGQTYRWTEFEQTGAIPCLLIAVGMRKALLRVPFDAVVKV